MKKREHAEDEPFEFPFPEEKMQGSKYSRVLRCMKDRTAPEWRRKAWPKGHTVEMNDKGKIHVYDEKRRVVVWVPTAEDEAAEDWVPAR